VKKVNPVLRVEKGRDSFSSINEFGTLDEFLKVYF